MLHFPGSALIDAADGDQIITWIGEGDDGQQPADAVADAVDRCLDEGVVALDHEERGAEDGAVHGDER